MRQIALFRQYNVIPVYTLHQFDLHRRLLIGRDRDIDQSEAYYAAQTNEEKQPLFEPGKLRYRLRNCLFTCRASSTTYTEVVQHCPVKIKDSNCVFETYAVTVTAIAANTMT